MLLGRTRIRSAWAQACILVIVISLTHVGSVVSSTYGRAVEPDLILYSDTWTDASAGEDGEAPVPIYGRAVAETTYPGDPELRYPSNIALLTEMKRPSGEVVDSDYSHSGGIGYVESQFVETTVDAESPMGEYTVAAQAWVEGEHYGCVFAFLLLSIGILTYQLHTIQSGNVARYVRCNPGNRCKWIRFKKDTFSPPAASFPTYAIASVLSAAQGFIFVIYVCYAVSYQPVDSCVPDALPLP